MNPSYLIYDWNCDFCTKLMRLIKKIDRNNSIVFVPFDDPVAKELAHDLTEEALRGSFHYVAADGKRYSGDDAIPYVVGSLPGGRIPQWILLHMPGRRMMLRAFYKRLASMRNSY